MLRGFVVSFAFSDDFNVRFSCQRLLIELTPCTLNLQWSTRKFVSSPSGSVAAEPRTKASFGAFWDWETLPVSSRVAFHNHNHRLAAGNPRDIIQDISHYVTFFTLRHKLGSALFVRQTRHWPGWRWQVVVTRRRRPVARRQQSSVWVLTCSRSVYPEDDR